MKKLSLIALLAFSLLAGGCSWFHSNTRDPQWRSAVQEPPLEVPPDLAKPTNAAALIIPDVANKPSAEAPVATPPDTQATTDASSAIGSSMLVFSDTLDSVYHRIGLALKRGDIGKLQSQNDAAHAYEVVVATTVEEKPHGFFSRIFSRHETREVNGMVKVSVSAEADGRTRVELQGPEDAVRQLQSALKQRLG